MAESGSRERGEAVVQEAESRKEIARTEASAELTIMLKQVEICFGKYARSDDLESLSFSLRHLFSRADFLYCHALPSLKMRIASKQGDYHQETLQKQQTWLQLQTINRTLDRMASLCHLLSDAIECLLDTLEDEEIWLRTLNDEETLQMKRARISWESEQKPEVTNDLESPDPLPQEHWERAIGALMDQVSVWQERHHRFFPFSQQFAPLPSLEYNLSALDSAFAILLDSGGAIFGDILPHFRLVGPADREEISALLFDLMQQSDQMLVQFEVTLEPFTRLIRHFADTSENA
jgi:hypothetical protein